MKKKALGKGLSALIPEGVKEIDETNPTTQLLEVPIDRIKENPDQPRKDFDQESLKELAISIKRSGLIQPIIVRRKDDDFEIIAGERRLKASKIAGLESVKAILAENLTPARRMEIALIENLQRTDLNPIETAAGIRELMTKSKLTQEQVAENIGKERSTIANLLRLLSLPEEIQDDLRSGTLSSGHGRILAGIENAEARKKYWTKAVKENWSVRKLENSVKGIGRRKPKKDIPGFSSPYRDAEDHLRSRLGTKVRITKAGKKGKIEIEFYDNEQLNGILDKIK
ncbi:MAG: ParB/RepB/Spo0J family partition protein [candidate division Zixibacteria bacterium]|nr:ParB/RepB/Spo0J family partition protein [candidate division Zixibacteria bacterium]